MCSNLSNSIRSWSLFLILFIVNSCIGTTSAFNFHGPKSCACNWNDSCERVFDTAYCRMRLDDQTSKTHERIIHTQSSKLIQDIKQINCWDFNLVEINVRISRIEIALHIKFTSRHISHRSSNASTTNGFWVQSISIRACIHWAIADRVYFK